MTLYKGENVEHAIAWLESEATMWAARQKTYREEGMVTRPIFQIFDDNEYHCEEDENCVCFWYPYQPLGSTDWTEKEEKDWLEHGQEPVLPIEKFNHYYATHKERVDRVLRAKDNLLSSR